MRKGKRSVFLFVLFLLFFPVSVFAYDWEEVLSAYLSVPINYPDSSPWIEKTATGGYNIWKRPTDSLWKEQMVSTVTAVVFWSSTTNVVTPILCSSGWQNQYSTDVTLRQTLSNSNDRTSCINIVLASSPADGSYNYVTYPLITGAVQSGGSGSACTQSTESVESIIAEYGWIAPQNPEVSYDCKSYDVLVNTFPDNEVTNCENRSLTMSVDGYSVEADPLISNSCQCTPSGTKYTETSAGGSCIYKNVVGDPTDPNTHITITAPGFFVMNSSPPVTTQVTNPDGTQSQDSTSVTTYPDSSTSTDVTTGANIIGGVAIGGTNTNTITSGSNTLSTTTYPSTLQVTTSTVGGATTTTLTKKDGEGGGGDIWADPPPTVTVPSIPSATSHISEYPTTLDTVPENDIKTLIGDFIATSPLVSAVQNTRIETIDSECSFTSGDVFGSPITLDFCSLDYLFQIFGVLFVIICTFRSFFILFGID